MPIANRARYALALDPKHLPPDGPMTVSTEEHVTVVRSPRVIAKMIARHYEQRGHVTLLPVDDVDYQGLVSMVGNDPDRQRFLIDQPPPVVVRHLKQAGKIKVQAVIDQLLVWFYVSELPEVVEGGDRYFELPYPSQMERLQRRGAFRVALPPGVSGVLAFCSEPGAEVRSASVVDISTGGLAIDMPLDEAQALTVGMTVEAARVRVADYFDLKVKFEVCNVRSISDKRAVVGLKFIDLPAVDGQQIDRAVLQWQREQLSQV